jgi:hypothetical protein
MKATRRFQPRVVIAKETEGAEPVEVIEEILEDS